MSDNSSMRGLRRVFGRGKRDSVKSKAQNSSPKYSAVSSPGSTQDVVFPPEHASSSTIAVLPARHRHRILPTPLPSAHPAPLDTISNTSLNNTGRLRKRLDRFVSYRDSATAVVLPSDGKQLPSTSANMATSSTTAASTPAKMTPLGTNKLPCHLDDTKDIVKVDFLHDSGKPMAQVRNALSYVGGGQHTVNIYVDWQLPEFVRDGLDKTQDLATVLTITDELDEAYVVPARTM